LKDFNLIRFEGLELDPAARVLKRDGKPIPLSPKTFELLVYLAGHAQQVLTKEELLTAVWPNAHVEESNLAQHIFLLRKALAGIGLAERTVVTLPGRGYQFTAPVEIGRVSEPAPPGSNVLVMNATRSVTHVTVEQEYEDEDPAEKALAQPVSKRGWKFWSIAAAALAVAAAGSIAAWRWANPAPVGHVDLVMADLENATGDRDFDRTLNQALQIDLEQTPFLNLLSRSVIQETLALMQQPKVERLTPALALEVCQRNNAQATLSGTISRLGNSYLLILEAESCISGKQLAGAKAEVASKEEVLGALDRTARQVRRQLGESPASREKYQIPIAEATTPSFGALLAYTQAGESFRRGDMKASQVLLERAISLDPNFASAYRILASSYYNLGDYSEAAAYYKKAFDLRERTTERERLGIEVMYFGYGLNDFEESIRRTRQFLAIYPKVANSWVSLCNMYDRLGEYPEAIEAAERAIAIDPHSGVAAVELMRSQMRLGRFEAAKATAKAAMSDGKDHWDIHSMLFQIAFAERDTAKAKTEGEWGLTHQHVNIALEDQAMAAAAGGRLREATEEIFRARAEARRNSERDFDNGAALDLAEIQSEFGYSDEAMATLRTVSDPGGDPATPGRVALLQALNGYPEPAKQFLTASETSASRNTLTNSLFAPLVRGALALAAHRPADAITAMAPARPYQLAGFSAPYLRARAESEAGMLDAAAADYRLILANQGVDPISPLYSLAHLRLGEVLAKKGQAGPARLEYQAFLDAWREASEGEPLKKQALAELKALENPQAISQ
jgi:DNA-binding winged helix-turn-helix (wHTH) protein/tetratricopeptide (TPR) repeat protein